MAGATIGALRFVLGADTAAFERGMANAQTRLKSLGAAVKRTAVVAAAAFAAIGAAAGVAIKRAIDEMDQLGELSQSIGVPVERLTALAHAAELSGLSVQELGRSFRNVARNMQGAAEAPTAFSRALSSINIQFRDAQGNFIAADKLMLQVANRFAGMQDGAGKTALAMKIFGEEMGPRLIPLLNSGSAGIRALTDEARRMGLVFGTEATVSAGRFNDAFDKLGKLWEGIIKQLTAKLLPSLASFAESLLKCATNSETLKQAMNLLAIVIRVINNAFTAVFGTVEALTRAFRTLFDAAKLFLSGDWQGASERLRGLASAAEALRSAGEQVVTSWTGAKNSVDGTVLAIEAAAKRVPLAAPPIVASTASVANEMRRLKEEARAAMDAIINAPTETFTAKMAAVDEALRKGVINMSAYGRITRRIAEDNQRHWLNLGSAVASALTGIFGENKAASIAAAIINTAVGITRALATLPPPFSWAQAALIAATGAAQIATIKSTSKSGSGNAPTVRGSSGGESEPETGPAQQLIVSGIDPADIFSGEAVRNLAQKLVDFQKDGGLVVIR